MLPPPKSPPKSRFCRLFCMPLGALPPGMLPPPNRDIRLLRPVEALAEVVSSA